MVAILHARPCPFGLRVPARPGVAIWPGFGLAAMAAGAVEAPPDICFAEFPDRSFLPGLGWNPRRMWQAPRCCSGVGAGRRQRPVGQEGSERSRTKSMKRASAGLLSAAGQTRLVSHMGSSGVAAALALARPAAAEAAPNAPAAR